MLLQDSEDIRYMVGALKDLGIKLEEDWRNDKILVHGCGGRFPVENAELFLGNAGTAMRYRSNAVFAPCHVISASSIAAHNQPCKRSPPATPDSMLSTAHMLVSF